VLGVIKLLVIKLLIQLQTVIVLILKLLFV